MQAKIPDLAVVSHPAGTRGGPPEEQEEEVDSSATNTNHSIVRNKTVDHTTSDEDEFEQLYNDRFKSIRSSTGLEIGIAVSWPGICCWELSTCLSSDCIAPLFHGTQWAGTRVWRAAVVALEYLLSDEVPITIGPQHSVIELGCGLGVPGMILHALRNCAVVLTDMGDLIPTVQENLNRVFQFDNASDSSCCPSRTITARELDWSNSGVERLLQDTGLRSFDVVLNCDCIFEPLYGESWKHLLQCQVALLRTNPMALVLTSVERRKFDGIDKYLQALTDAGVATEAIQPKTFVYPPQVELYRLYLPGTVESPR